MKLKKILSSVIAAAMVLSTMSFNVLAASTATVDDAVIQFTNGETSVYAEAKNLDAEESVYLELLSGETKLATTTLQKSEYFKLAELGTRFLLSGDSSSWKTVWETGYPVGSVVPDTVALYVDGEKVDTSVVHMSTNLDYIAETAVNWADLDGVYNPIVNSFYLGGDAGYENAYICTELYDFYLKETFVQKVYSKGELIAEASLNAGLLSSGAKTSLGSCIGFGGDYDSYWTTTWHKAPNTAQIPDKVEVWVDGVKAAEKSGVIGDHIKGFDPATGSNALYPLTPENYFEIDGVSGVAEINGTQYATLQSAFDAAADGDTIVVLDDYVLSEGTLATTDDAAVGYAGVNYTGDKNVTLDLNEKTITFEGAADYNAIRVDNQGVKDNTVTIKNGTIVAENIKYALEASSDSNYASTLVLEDLTVNSKHDNGYTVIVREGCKVEATNVTVNAEHTGGFVAAGEMVINNCDVTINGVSPSKPYKSMAIGSREGTGKVTVNGGNYTVAGRESDGWNPAAVGVMSSGGEITINDGVFTQTGAAKTIYALMYSDNEGGSTPFSRITVNGGTFNAVSAITQWNSFNNWNTEILLKGGTYNLDPVGNIAKLADGYEKIQTGSGYYKIAEPAATEIAVQFDDITPADAEGYKEYDIVLSSTSENEINRLTSVDLTFTNSSTLSANGATLPYTIVKSANVAEGMEITKKADDRYMFNFDGVTNEDETAVSIVIGTVRFEGYGELDFKVNATAVDEVGKLSNVANATKTADNIVEHFIPDGNVANGTGKLVVNKDIDLNDNDELVGVIKDTQIAVPSRNLTINVTFPNAVDANVAAYQDMQVVISGGDITPATADTFKYALGEDMTTDGKYVVNAELTKGRTYTVTVSGAGYRTFAYDVTMDNAKDEVKELTFWNNVMDAPKVVEKDNTDSAETVTFLAGDIVKDDNINIYDLSAVVSYFATKTTTTGYDEKAQYDLNRDGMIDSKDVAYVLVSWGK